MSQLKVNKYDKRKDIYQNLPKQNCMGCVAHYFYFNQEDEHHQLKQEYILSSQYTL